MPYPVPRYRKRGEWCIQNVCICLCNQTSSLSCIAFAICTLVLAALNQAINYNPFRCIFVSDVVGCYQAVKNRLGNKSSENEITICLTFYSSPDG